MIAPPSSSNPLSPTQTLVDGRVPQKYSAARRYVLLLIFCLAQFLDAVNNSALFSAIPDLENDLGINEAQSTWVISAFQLTFASFLLISGRISDVYNPKVAFTGGVAALGLISVGAGFARDKIAIIILRALSGIAAAMTIPSALALLVSVFVEPTEQARAIGLFGGCGAIGNVLGLIIGAIFVQYASWPWVFWFVAIVAALITGACVLLVPPQEPKVRAASARPRWHALDLVGVSLLTAALVLFIFAVTSGSADGWASAAVLVPLLVAVLMVAAFFWHETRVPPETAAVPPRTWFLPNFAVLFATALLPYFWWTTVFTVFTLLWQDVYRWSAISTAIHMIPIGVLAFAMSWTGPLARRVNPKWIILSGEGLLAAATVLLALADGPRAYWPRVFPAFVLGSAGAMLAYTHTNIAIFRAAPAAMAGTVGAIFNGALQLGSAVGIAAVDSLQASVQAAAAPDTQDTPYAGQRAAFWFLLGVVGVEFVAMALFYRTGRERREGGDGAADADAAGKEVEVAEQEEKEKGGDPDVDGKLEEARCAVRVMSGLASAVEAARTHSHLGHGPASLTPPQTPAPDAARVSMGFRSLDEHWEGKEEGDGLEKEVVEVEEARRADDSPV